MNTELSKGRDKIIEATAKAECFVLSVNAQLSNVEDAPLRAYLTSCLWGLKWARLWLKHGSTAEAKEAEPKKETDPADDEDAGQGKKDDDGQGAKDGDADKKDSVGKRTSKEDGKEEAQSTGTDSLSDSVGAPGAGNAAEPETLRKSIEKAQQFAHPAPQ